MKFKFIWLGLLVMVALAAVGCGTIQEAVEQRVAEEIVDQVAGEGAVATVEAMATAAQNELDRRDTDGDGEVSEAEAQAAMNEPGASPLNPIIMVAGQSYSEVTNLSRPLFYRADVPAGGTAVVEVQNTGSGEINFSLGNAPYNTEYPSTIAPGQTVSIPMIFGEEATQLSLSFITLTETEFTVQANIGNQNDANTGTDAGIRDNATPITPGTGYAGSYGGRDEEDYYSLRTGANDVLKITVTSAATNKEPLVLYGELSSGAYNSVDNILPGNSATLTLADNAENIAKFGFYGGTAASYTFDVAVSQAGDAGTAADIGNTFATAMPVTLGQTVSGISIMGDQDCYSFTLPQDGVIVVELTSPTDQPYEADASADIYLPDGSYLWGGSATYGANGTVEHGTADYPTAAGEYMACGYTSDYWTLGYYSLTVTSR